MKLMKRNLSSCRRALAAATRGVAIGCAVLGVSFATGGSAVAQVGWTIAPPASLFRPRPETSPLSRPQREISVHEKGGTAFFVDDSGHMLTARHAAEDCIRLIVGKEGRAVVAHVVALSAESDLALIKVPRTLGLAAVFPDGAGVSANDMVFAQAYDILKASRGMIANATVAANADNKAKSLLIDSEITFGSSGAPVLDGRGLVQGVVSRKIGATRVIAVGAGEVKAFLAAHGIHFDEDDRPQLAGTASRASRAASISAHVTCVGN